MYNTVLKGVVVEGSDRSNAFPISWSASRAREIFKNLLLLLRAVAHVSEVMKNIHVS